MDRRIALAYAGLPVAEAILERLPAAGVSPEALTLLDNEMRAGQRVSCSGARLTTQIQSEFDFADCALLLLPEADPELARRAEAAGCLVVGHLLDDEAVLFGVGPAGEADPPAVGSGRLRIAGPALACLLPVLLALAGVAPLRRISTVLLHSAEFHGKPGIDELAAQTIDLLNSRDARASVYPARIAFDLLAGTSDPRLFPDLASLTGVDADAIVVQSIDVPVFHGFAAALQLSFAGAVDPDACKARIAALDGVKIETGKVSALSDCQHAHSCAISHLEQAPTQPTSLQFWMLADPIRYGLAKNYVNVTEFLLNSYL